MDLMAIGVLGLVLLVLAVLAWLGDMHKPGLPG
jgi:hypothetical protein